MRTTILLALLLLSACTTVEFVRKDLTPEKKAILRFSPQSNPDKEAKHRALLDKKARDFCGGDYQITKEYQALDETDSSVGVGTGIGTRSGATMGGIFVGSRAPSTTMYQFVELNCK